MDIFEIGSKVGLFFLPFLFAICFHEWAHAWVASLKGDPTAEMMGRKTLNPGPHIDPVGTLAFPLIAILTGSPLFFGWAKPVPVSARNLKKPKEDMFWIALAGPMSNFILAFVGAFFLAFNSRFNPMPEYAEVANQILQYFIIINLSLFVFNFIPIHPLDGGKIIARFLPLKANMWLEQNSGMLGMVLLAYILISGFSGGGISIWLTQFFF